MLIEQNVVRGAKSQYQHPKIDRKESHPEGRKLASPMAFNLPSKQTKSNAKLSIKCQSGDHIKQLLVRRDKNKQAQSRQQKHAKKLQDDNKSEKNIHPHNKSYSQSKSKSKSKRITKSKSLKQLPKKSKSMVRLGFRDKISMPIERLTKEQRKSQSPPKHIKSIISNAQKKNYKSNYNSKTNKDIISELATEREKSKSKLKISQISKPAKKSKIIEDKKKWGIFKSQMGNKRLTQKQNVKIQDKQNIKTQRKGKLKTKRYKKVITSEQTSRVKHNDCEQWQLNQYQFLEPKNKQLKEKQFKKNKENNIVLVPKRKERLSLNNHAKRLIQVKNKTEAEMETHRSKKKQIEHCAAVIIQKVFRGYLTRKYIRQCFEHNAAINIQRFWRGYRVRKELLKLKKSRQSQIQQKYDAKRDRILEQEQYLLQKSSSRQDSLRNSQNYNERWASILEEILSEQSVNENIKKKIQNFLQNQRRQMSEFEYRSNRSMSARSSISNQIVTSEINSEKQFIESQKMKKQYPSKQVYISPSNFKSPNKFLFNSPQAFLMNSPLNFLNNQTLNHSEQITSAQLLIQNLKNIQKFHKERLQNKANNQKEELNKMLIKNKLSPRTHQKKYKEVQQFLENQLEKFNESINEIVKNCMLYKEQSPNQDQNKKIYEEFMQFNDDNMIITPKKQLAQLQLYSELPEDCIKSQKFTQNENDSLVLANFKKIQQKSLQFKDYYQQNKQSQVKQLQQQCFDTTYQFIEEYLINLIDFVRQFQNGHYIQRILDVLKKPKNHQMQTIFNNLRVVTEGSDSQDNDCSFKLPMYKYIDLDEEIIGLAVVQQFNMTFNKLRRNENGIKNDFQECFIKMIAESMNQALNMLRPTAYFFTETRLCTINTLKSMENVPIFESDNNSQSEMQYQYMCAQALNKIFYWNKMQWGKIVSIKNCEEEQLDQMRFILFKQQQKSMNQVYGKQTWQFHQELIELIGELTQQLFYLIVYEEIATVWSIFIDWSDKICIKEPIIKVPNNKLFFQN